MNAYPKREKPLLAQVFDIIWSDSQLQQELFSLVDEVADDTVTWQYVGDWIELKAAERLPHKAKQIGELNFVPFFDFLQTYTGKGSESPTIEVKTLIVDVALSAQVFVNGSLTLEVPIGLSQEERERSILSHAGEVTWIYNGVIDGTEHIEKIERTGHVLGQGCDNG